MTRPVTHLFAATSIILMLVASALAQPGSFTIKQIRSNPFPNELTASSSGSRIAWAFNEQGQRNIYAAEGPDFKARQLTHYTQDDGQELTSVSISSDGKYVVFVRGGEHSANWDGPPPNPGLSPIAPKVQIWSVPFAGGETKLVADGDDPVISPRNDLIAFVRDRSIWVAPVYGGGQPRRMFSARGDISSPSWSPDGSRLSFVSGRGEHSFIGIYTNETTPILFLAPSTSRDSSPQWSPDGKKIVFVRRPGLGGPPASMLERQPQPWALWVADASSGEGALLWQSPRTMRGSVPNTHGGTNLHWAANGRIVFMSYKDGWPHMYSVSEAGGEPLLLTPGNYMAEYVQLSADRRYLVFCGNAGSGPDDIDRRHIVKVPVDKATPEVMTPGNGLEWTPFVTGDGKYIAFLGATAQRPPLPMIMPFEGGKPTLLAEDRIPADFPASSLVTPQKVVFKAPDGMEVHAQLFAKPGSDRKPAIIFVHGGPPRQMLLGWHYSDYYSNSYSMNQYLASKGFAVLSVNYRLGIGYGYDFHNPAKGGVQGASEYQDVKAAGEYLRRRSDIDSSRIGIYGGSYGGYLTALALGRNSDIFAAGVDIHGVHDWTADSSRRIGAADGRYEKTDRDQALEVGWQSSPVSSISTWKSPVLFIHADDDRNVRFSQTVDLVRRLEKTNVKFTELVIPDDTHHFLKNANWIKVDEATAKFFEGVFMNRIASK